MHRGSWGVLNEVQEAPEGTSPVWQSRWVPTACCLGAPSLRPCSTQPLTLNKPVSAVKPGWAWVCFESLMLGFIMEEVFSHWKGGCFTNSTFQWSSSENRTPINCLSLWLSLAYTPSLDLILPVWLTDVRTSSENHEDSFYIKVSVLLETVHLFCCLELI